MITFPIEVAGIMYEVKEEEYKGMNEANLGYCDSVACEISLRAGLTEDRTFETFIHELTHAMLTEAGYRYTDDEIHTEDFVERFSKVLYQVCISNDIEEIKNYFYNFKESELDGGNKAEKDR